ncbi:MAG: hypothetical protein R3C10_01985 [Pirellulales bacterium]
MNDITQLDRLVDGELSEQEREETLRRLDVQPDGWRRCALAFLEAQVWRESAHALGETAHSRAVPRVAAAPQSVGTASVDGGVTDRSRRRSWSAAALAASIALAFALGFAGGDRWRYARDSSATRDNVNVVNNALPVPSEIDTSASDTNGDGGLAATARTVGYDGPRVRVGFLEVPDAGDGTLSHLPVKVVEGPGVDESWLEHVPPALPEEYVELLRQQGYEVQQQREIVPFDVAGNQQVVLPVDRVKIVPVSDTVY